MALYHALPHGLRDGLRQLFEPHFYRYITAALPHARAILAYHASQKEWQDVSQGMNTYLDRNGAPEPPGGPDELAI